MISQKATEIDKTKNNLEDQHEKIQSAIESTRAEIIFGAAAEHGGSIPDLSFSNLRPEIQEFVSGEQHISKSFGILTSVKLSNKSHDTELKVLKTYTTDLPVVTRLISLDKKRACIYSHTINALRQVVIEDKIKTFTEISAKIYDMALTKSKDILFYPAISTFAVQICYTNKFLLYSY
jgi:hypothetical protein